jgi:hypothetical protein
MIDRCPFNFETTVSQLYTAWLKKKPSLEKAASTISTHQRSNLSLELKLARLKGYKTHCGTREINATGAMNLGYQYALKAILKTFLITFFNP